MSATSSRAAGWTVVAALLCMLRAGAGAGVGQAPHAAAMRSSAGCSAAGLCGGRSAVLARSRVLRGGQAEAEAEESGEGGKEEDSVPVAEAPTRRLSLAVAEETAEPSTVELSGADLEELGLEDGEMVLVQGRKRRRTACMAVSSKKAKTGQIRLSAATRANLRLETAELTVVRGAGELPALEKLRISPIEESLKGFEDDPFDAALKPFLTSGDRPVHVGDVIETPCVGEHEGRTIRWKVRALQGQAPQSCCCCRICDLCNLQVLEAEPECAIVSEDPKPEVYGVDEPISEDEAEDDGRIGYEDIGGLGKVFHQKNNHQWHHDCLTIDTTAVTRRSSR